MPPLQKGAVRGIVVLFVVLFAITAFFYFPVIKTAYSPGVPGFCTSQNTVGCPECNYWDSLSQWLFGIGYQATASCMSLP